MATADIQKELDEEEQPGDPPKKGEGAGNRGAEFGTAEPATAGTDRDADRSGKSKNQGHGHPKE